MVSSQRARSLRETVITRVPRLIYTQRGKLPDPSVASTVQDSTLLALAAIPYMTAQPHSSAPMGHLLEGRPHERLQTISARRVPTGD